MPAPYAKHRRQLELILEAWGMEQATAAETAEIMAWADLHGIDTHGISMVPPYDERRRAGTVGLQLGGDGLHRNHRDQRAAV